MLLLHPLVLPYLLEIATYIALNLHNQQKTKKEAVAKKLLRLPKSIILCWERPTLSFLFFVHHISFLIFSFFIDNHFYIAHHIQNKGNQHRDNISDNEGRRQRRRNMIPENMHQHHSIK